MKAIVVSDIHKMIQREKVQRFFAQRKFDAIFVNGDLLGEYQIPRAVEEFGAIQRYLSASNGHALVRKCAPVVADELLEFLAEIRNRHPDKHELKKLENLLEQYATERYDGILSFLSELTKSGSVFFNYGESESPFGLAIENEIAKLGVADPDIIMKMRPTNVFPKFERQLYELEGDTHLFHYVSGRNCEFGGYVIAGIPGVYGESKGSESASEQEAITMRVLDEIETARRLILLYHSAAPSLGIFGKTRGSDTLMDFLKKQTAKTIVINSHYHLLNSVFVKKENVWYIVPTSAINDEVSMIDTEGVRYFEIRIESGRSAELSAVVIHDWKEQVPDLLKRMY